jgi:hypothetical protein
MRQVLSLFAAIAIGGLRNGCAYVLPTPTRTALRSHPSRHLRLRMSQNDELQSLTTNGDGDFWAKQKELAKEMTGVVAKSRNAEVREQFARRRLALLKDTAYFGFFIFCLLWMFFANPFVAFSYSLGTTLGLAYAYGLGRYVEKIGGSTIEDIEAAQGAGVGEARFAFLILLVIILGKFRSSGLLEIPSLLGFFTYQLATLNQGLRDIED